MAQTVRASATRTYAEGEMVSVNGGEGAIDASSDVSAFVGLEDFTFNATFTVTGSSVNSLFFLGDSTRQNNYITVYVNGHTIGVESRDASGAQQISGRLVDLGIRGFWNFSHYDLSVPYPNAVVENVHLGDSLMSLGYRLRND